MTGTPGRCGRSAGEEIKIYFQLMLLDGVGCAAESGLAYFSTACHRYPVASPKLLSRLGPPLLNITIIGRTADSLPSQWGQWWPRWESNPHDPQGRRGLSPARLPFPPRAPSRGDRSSHPFHKDRGRWRSDSITLPAGKSLNLPSLCPAWQFRELDFHREHDRQTSGVSYHVMICYRRASRCNKPQHQGTL